MKFQIPKRKFQITSGFAMKLEIENWKLETGNLETGNLKFGFWNLRFGIWDLKF